MLMDILEEIIAHKRVEVERYKSQKPEHEIFAEVERMLEKPVPSLRKALMDSDTGIIAEFKRRSPSKGWIKENGKAVEIPVSYQRNGASAVSILTDSKYFGGEDRYVMEARGSGLTLPVLYKNFVVDEYQLFQARACGASAVLLIASAISFSTCRMLLAIAHEIGLEVVLELHGEEELGYVDINPDVCGVNNRNLGTFVTDVRNSFNMIDKLPDNMCRISESGISSVDTIAQLSHAGFNGFLIGETFMRAADPGEALYDFIEELKAKKQSAGEGL